MNFKTTFVLILLAGAGAGGWAYLHYRHPAEAPAGDTLTFLKDKLTADKLTRVQLWRREGPSTPTAAAAGMVGALGAAAGQGPWNVLATRSPSVAAPLFVLEKHGQEWTLPGNWPVRKQEIEQWIGVLTSLDSRFAPVPLTQERDLRPFGMEDKTLEIKVTLGDKVHTLRFGEPPGGTRSFTRPTYVCLDDQAEVIQLGPGVFAALDRSEDYFRQRRLFPLERVTKEEGATDKVEQIAAAGVAVETKDAKYAIAKQPEGWILQSAQTKDGKEWKQAASVDRLDPDKRDAILRAFPDLWAEKFVEGPKKTLDEYGLTEPEYIVSATKPDGATIKLLIGKISRSERKTVLKQLGPQVMPSEVVAEYRFAKLDKNEQLFEVKTDKLRDLAVAPDELRDARLARFKTDDVKRLEIRHADKTLVFAKVKETIDDKDSKEKWRLEQPAKQDVEHSVVEELLDKLAAAQARGKEILDGADPKAVGLDAPAAQIKIAVEEIDKDAPTPSDPKDAKRKKREILWRIGVKPKETGKIFVRVDDWKRVNELSDDIFKLASRSELAYRPREIWKLGSDAITKISIDGGKQPYHLTRGDKGWKITGPLEADASGATGDSLADELARLKAERFEPSTPKDLAKFGLDRPAFKIAVTTKEGKPRELEIGAKAEGKDAGRYARLKGGDAVFVVSEKLTSGLRADPFDLLDANLLSLNPDGIERIRYQGDSSFTLESQKGRWQIVGSPAGTFPVEPEPLKTALFPWAKLRADRFAAVGPKIDFANYGLAKPSLTIVITADPIDKDKDKDKTPDPFEKGKLRKPVEHTLELGKEADGSGARYARLDKKDAVVVLDALTTSQITRTHLDFLDPTVLRLDGEAVMAIERKMPGADLELMRREDAWQIAKPALRDADILTIFDILRSVSLLRANRIVAFPAKDLKAFGLDKPAAIITFQLEIDGAAKKHVLKLGDPVKDSDKKDTGERYAMVDDQPKVIVLSAELARHLTAPTLYYADRNLAAFGNVDRIEMARAKRKLTFSRVAGTWEMTQPEPARAESAALDDLLRMVQRLRADEIVADKAADLKKYGLDQPAAQWRFKAGTTEPLNLLIGAAENEKSGARRYAKLADKNVIFLVSEKLAARALAEFRDRTPMPTFDASKVKALVVTAGKDKPFTLEKKDDKWTIAGDAKAAVKEEIVGDAIDTLKSLRALRYVEDAKADLKAYGLTSPTWKIEAQLPVGKREIWIGGFEDKSKGVYATVPGAGAVFVLDEIDAAALMRPRSAFVEAEKKK